MSKIVLDLLWELGHTPYMENTIMKLKIGFKLYKMIEDGQEHIASPSRLTALCGVNTYGLQCVHPDDAKKICVVCQDRHDNKPGAWNYENNA